jgi:hypothetical protein
VKSYLDSISRRFGIAVESGTSSVSLKGSTVSGRWSKPPKVWTPRSASRSIAEELLNSTEAVSVQEIPETVAAFTRKYGPLTLPCCPGNEFDFTLSQWLGKRAELDAVWRLVSSARTRSGGAPVRAFVGNAEFFEFGVGGMTFHTSRLDTYISLEIAAVPNGRLRICPNRLDGCKCPYFIAVDLRNQYCSDRCASVAVRKTKLRWWNENRKEQ